MVACLSHFLFSAMKRIIAILILLGISHSATAAAAPRWPAKRANDWYIAQPFLVGSNFIPSTAIPRRET